MPEVVALNGVTAQADDLVALADRLDSLGAAMPIGSSQAALGQSAQSRQARSSTHRPISPIIPDRSAIAITVVGGTAPFAGWSQRSSTSAEVTAPSTVQTIGC